MTGVWKPEYGRAYRERKRLGIRSTSPNALTWDERFWHRVDTSAGLDGCWLWLGSIDSKGYGVAHVGKGSTTAHRDVYQHLVGAVPDDLELDHLCRNRRCVNPTHMEIVTHRENSQRASHSWGKKTHCKSGHAFDEGNTLHVEGRRRCRACIKERAARYRARQRASA